MYPAVPVGALVGGRLAMTGLPVTGFLVAATVLILSGLLALRTSAVLGRRPEGAAE